MQEIRGESDSEGGLPPVTAESAMRVGFNHVMLISDSCLSLDLENNSSL